MKHRPIRKLTPCVKGRGLQAPRQGQHDPALRQARTCYDHLAGTAGGQLLDAMIDRGWMEVEAGDTSSRPPYHLCRSGEVALRARGVSLAQARRACRRLAFGCPDWMDGRFHLGGSLGVQILEALRRSGTVRRQSGTRAVTILQPLETWLDYPAMSE